MTQETVTASKNAGGVATATSTDAVKEAEIEAKTK
jgi:hypothetical protein